LAYHHIVPATEPAGHVPVLLKETVRLLDPKPGDRVLDLTLGLGGHAAALCELLQGRGELVALDADEMNLTLAKERLKGLNVPAHFLHANFSAVATLNVGEFDAVLADLGLNSLHVDDAARGFSFRFEGPLDLRFDRTSGQTAAEKIEHSDEEELIAALRDYGELRFAGKLAGIIRRRAPKTTGELKAAVEEWGGRRAPGLLPQVFQALRIWVNDELAALDNLLKAIPDLLRPGGRAGIISFHSLEDRRVKHAFRALTDPPRDELTGKRGLAPFELLTPKAIRPDESETSQNPRSRSALLRAIRRR
jgi:16S rRNA (cytosine1402-N4)-methyltransferase